MKNLAKKGFLGLIVVMFLSVNLVGCSSGISKAELEKQVAASIEETINGSTYGRRSNGINPFLKFEVRKVTLVKKGENEYTGNATIIGTYKDDGKTTETMTESLTVIADKDSFQWEFK
jgi:hypothetical protein